MTAMMPISLCRRIEKVAESKNTDFSGAVSFLLEKVEAPRAHADKNADEDANVAAGEQDKEGR